MKKWLKKTRKEKTALFRAGAILLRIPTAKLISASHENEEKFVAKKNGGMCGDDDLENEEISREFGRKWGEKASRKKKGELMRRRENNN